LLCHGSSSSVPFLEGFGMRLDRYFEDIFVGHFVMKIVSAEYAVEI